EKVIGTIRSRTHHYPFRLVPPAKLTAYMERLLEAEGVPVAPGVLSFVTRAGGGSVRDSLSVLDQLIAGSGPEGLTYESAVSLLGFTDGELLDATVDALAAGDGAATFRQIDKVIESGHDPRRFIEDLLERLRDLIIVAAVPDAGQVLRGVPEDQLERMRVQQSAFGPGALSRAADIVNAGLTEMTGATAPRMQLELICARILLPASSGEGGYGARLDRLERRLEVGGVPSAAAVSPADPPPGRMPPSSPPQDTAVPAERPAPSRAHEAPGAATTRAQDVPRPDQTWAEDVPRADQTRAQDVPQPDRPSADAVPRPERTSAQDGPRPDRTEGAKDSPPPPGAQGGAPAGAPATPTVDRAPAGGMDTDAIRRAWPDVLGRIFSRRRITWTFVSQHAQVVAYDGSTLTLGIATAGLTNTFRSGNHAEIVRQALIDELGVDAVVDGVHIADGGQGTSAPEAPSSPQTRPQDDGPSGRRSLEDNAGWGSVSAPAPDWATSPEPEESSGPPVNRRAADVPDAPGGQSRQVAGAGEPGSAPDPSSAAATPAGTRSPSTSETSPRGAGVVRESLGAARRGVVTAASGPTAPTTDDTAVSDDDEDIELSGDVGRSVIEKVLGGRVIAETED
uniref:DNA polymerase III subunit gamma and tau n=1 Tax=Intrasporangium sp. TaxID=1925024 RepID=UPI002939A7BE